MSNKKEIGFYMIATYIYIGMNAISNIFVSKILGPSVLGAISYFNAIDNNLNSYVLGIIRSSIEREIPQMDEEVMKKKFGETAFTLNLLLISIFSIVYLIISLFAEQPIMKQCALWVCALSYFKGLYDYCRIWHKANFNIIQVSSLMLISALAIPPIVLVLAYYFTYHGFWLGRLIIVLISLVLLVSWMPRIHLRRPNLMFVKYILASGGPIIIFGLIQTVYQTLDKYIINCKDGLEQLGYYSIGAMVFNMMLLLPQSFVGAIFPRFVARKNDNLKSKVDMASTVIQLICVMISCIGIIITPHVIGWFLPKYMESIPVINTFFIGFVAYSSCQLKYVDLIRTHKIKTLLFFCFIPFVITVLLFVYYAFSEYGIREMALLTSLNFFLLSTAVNYAWCKANLLNVVKTIKILSVHSFLSLVTLFLSYHDFIRLY